MCDCEYESHVHIFRDFVKFVQTYNSSRDKKYHITLSDETYDNLSMYKFIQYVDNSWLIGLIYSIWTDSDKYTIDYHDNVFVTIIIDDNSFVVKPLQWLSQQHWFVLNKFAKFCNESELLHRFYCRWLNEYYECGSSITKNGKRCVCSSDRHKYEYNKFMEYVAENKIVDELYNNFTYWHSFTYKQPTCQSPITKDGLPCLCNIHCHKKRYIKFVSYALINDISVSLEEYERWWLRVY